MNKIEFQIETVLKDISAKSGNALIEAGHIYANKTASLEQKAGLQIGALMVKKLSDLGLNITTMLFVDNYNAPEDNLLTAVNSCLSIGVEAGFPINNVVYEKEIVTSGKAQKLIDELVSEAGTQSVITRKNRVRLLVGRQKDGRHKYPLDLKVKKDLSHLNEWKYTCELIDAALYFEKASMTNNGLLVTVLPLAYCSQQKRTKDILKTLNFGAPILNIYYDNNPQEIKVDFDY